MPKLFKVVTIDLHRMSVDEAEQYFKEFIQKNIFEENTQLRVIIGKRNFSNKRREQGLIRKKIY